jgi:hypothetical protein
MDILVGFGEIALRVVAVVLLADFFSGVFHWLEDAYGCEDWPVVGPFVTQANVIHHYDPRHFTRHSWFASAKVLVVLVVIGLGLAYLAGLLNWMTLLFASFGLNANEVHKWSHRTKAENGRLISFLQKAGLVQSPAHHARHHQRNKNTNNCVLTNYLNPILDKTGFWRGLEWLILHLTGTPRRIDYSVHRELRTTPIPACPNQACLRAAQHRLRRDIGPGRELHAVPR